MAKLGIQLYTVRDAMDKDFAGTIRQIAKTGYDGIEFGGPGPYTPADFKAFCKEIGVIPFGAHTGLKGAEEKPAELFGMYRTIGSTLLASSERADSEDGWKKIADRVNQAGRAALTYGIQWQYHNHAHEFVKYGGKTALEILAANTDPAQVSFQIDVGWVKRAGEDPVAWLNKFKGRIKTVHLKDTTLPPDPQWTEVGTGTVDVPAVYKAATALGVEWFIVEQDTCARPSVEAAAISYTNARKLLR